MKKNISVLFALFLLLTIGFGCSFLDGYTGGGASNTATNPATNSATNMDPNATAKTGVAECDELIDALNRDRSNPNDDFVTRKIKEVAIDYAKEQIKRSIDENQGDKQKIAQGCRQARDEYNRSKETSSENSNAQ